jgi:hypothetical protein
MQTALKMSESPESAAVPQIARYARAINASKRVRWDSDVDVTTSTQPARAYKSKSSMSLFAPELGMYLVYRVRWPVQDVVEGPPGATY